MSKNIGPMIDQLRRSARESANDDDNLRASRVVAMIAGAMMLGAIAALLVNI